MATRLALLGDSIAWGQGASRRRDRLGPRLAAGLAASGVEVEARVFAVRGARSSGLAAQVDAAVPWSPSVAVVVIGANDLTHREPVGRAVRALADAVRRLRAAGAQVVVAPAPDLSAVPHVPPFLRETVRAASQALRERQVAAVLAEGGHVADAEQRASRSFGSDPSLFAADRFHPSSAGYAVIAAELLPVLADVLADLGAEDAEDAEDIQEAEAEQSW
jgi:lysophospholipase L1-like esterase